MISYPTWLTSLLSKKHVIGSFENGSQSNIQFWVANQTRLVKIHVNTRDVMMKISSIQHLPVIIFESDINIKIFNKLQFLVVNLLDFHQMQHFKVEIKNC